jgi:DNA-binding winged helix-turn-helix (wHTH) protein
MSEITKMARLEIILGPHQGHSVPIEKTPWLVGRDESCDYTVESERLSRQHARIVSKDGRWFLINLKSTNGTYLNGNKLQDDDERALTDDYEIQLGKIIIFRFKDPAKTLSESYSQVMIPGLWINAETGDVFVQMQILSPRLKTQEISFLLMLFQQPGKIFTKEQIIEKLCPDQYQGGITPGAIDAEILRIRQRLRSLDAGHEYIETVRGEGRKFVQRPS